MVQLFPAKSLTAQAVTVSQVAGANQTTTFQVGPHEGT